MTNRERLDAYLTGRGISSDAFADALGCATSTIYNLRNGHLTAPGRDLARDIAEATGGEVPADEWPRTRKSRGRK